MAKAPSSDNVARKTRICCVYCTRKAGTVSRIVQLATGGFIRRRLCDRCAKLIPSNVTWEKAKAILRHASFTSSPVTGKTGRGTSNIDDFEV